MYTLYGFHGSGSAAVEMALARLGQPYRLVEAASWEPATSAYAELLTVNPLGQIPTLRLPDGAVLTESAAILIELGLRYPEHGLLPADAAARAQAIRGLVYIAANCYAAISIGDFPERWCDKADAELRARIRAGARQRLHEHWRIFADQFPATPWLSGARLGGLDMLAAVVSRWSGARAYLARERPDFAALLARIEAEAELAPLFARHWPS